MKKQKGQVYLERAASQQVEALSGFFPCVLITGARQVGKSTMLKKLKPAEMKYVTLDDYLLADYARKDPAGFLNEWGTPLCIDEVQYAPELLRAIKLKVDEVGQEPGMYWLTGSQRFVMMKGVSESLAGRIGIVDLHSLSQRELGQAPLNTVPFDPENPASQVQQENICGLQELFERIRLGGYPRLALHKHGNVSAYFNAYLQTYVERDVQALTQVSNQAAFIKLMRSAAMRTGQQLVYSDLARDAGVSPKTAAAWISILQTSGIVELLEPYYTNTTKRLAKSPKLYFMDTGLCCCLAGWESATQLMNSGYAGAILETWVYGQLVRGYANAGAKMQLSYYRDRNGAEVDFILEKNGCIYPMEVKRSSSPGSDDLRWVRSIPTSGAEIKPGIVFCTAEAFIPMPFGCSGFPISAL